MTGHSDCSERALARVGYGDDSQLENAPPQGTVRRVSATRLTWEGRLAKWKRGLCLILRPALGRRVSTRFGKMVAGDLARLVEEGKSWPASGEGAGEFCRALLRMAGPAQTDDLRRLMDLCRLRVESVPGRARPTLLPLGKEGFLKGCAGVVTLSGGLTPAGVRYALARFACDTLFSLIFQNPEGLRDEARPVGMPYRLEVDDPIPRASSIRAAAFFVAFMSEGRAVGTSTAHGGGRFFDTKRSKAPTAPTASYDGEDAVILLLGPDRAPEEQRPELLELCAQFGATAGEVACAQITWGRLCQDEWEEAAQSEFRLCVHENQHHIHLWNWWPDGAQVFIPEAYTSAQREEGFREAVQRLGLTEAQMPTALAAWERWKALHPVLNSAVHPDAAAQASLQTGTPRERGLAARTALGVEGSATLADAQRLAAWVNVRVMPDRLGGVLRFHDGPLFGVGLPCATLLVKRSAGAEEASVTIAELIGGFLCEGRFTHPGRRASEVPASEYGAHQDRAAAAGKEFAEAFIYCPLETAAREHAETMRRALDLTGPATLTDVERLAEWSHAKIRRTEEDEIGGCFGLSNGSALLFIPAVFSEMEQAAIIAGIVGSRAVGGSISTDTPPENWLALTRRAHRVQEAFRVAFLGWPEGFRTPEQLAREKREELGIKGPATYADVLRLAASEKVEIVPEDLNSSWIVGPFPGRWKGKTFLFHPQNWEFLEGGENVRKLASLIGKWKAAPPQSIPECRLNSVSHAPEAQRKREADEAIGQAFAREFLHWPASTLATGALAGPEVVPSLPSPLPALGMPAPRRFLIQCGNVQDVLTVQTGAGEWEITLPGDRTVDDSLGDLNAALQALEATSEEALAAYRQWCVVAGVSVDEKAVPRSAAWIGPRQARTRAREAAPESANPRKRTQPVTQRHPDLCRPRRRGLPSFPVAQVPVLH